MAQSKSTQWLLFAIASGACAAINGVFAKLTTTSLTSTWARNISATLGLDEQNILFDYVVRGIFLAMNLAFNGVMWGLFTRALTLASSTVRVSVINTSANFVITAVLGALVFGEELRGLWWIGAGLLVAGSVIIGRREEGVEGGKDGMVAGQSGSAGQESDGKTTALADQDDDAQEAAERRRKT